jgi:hypothetical protein
MKPPCLEGQLHAIGSSGSPYGGESLGETASRFKAKGADVPLLVVIVSEFGPSGRSGGRTAVE